MEGRKLKKAFLAAAVLSYRLVLALFPLFYGATLCLNWNLPKALDSSCYPPMLVMFAYFIFALPEIWRVGIFGHAIQRKIKKIYEGLLDD